MIVISVKMSEKSGAALRRVELSDGAKFTYSTDYLPPDSAELAPGGDISADFAAALFRAAACFRAERTALRFIARAEQYRAGLERKLEKKGISRAEIAAALDHLENAEIVSDKRYAEIWLRVKLRRVAAAREGGGPSSGAAMFQGRNRKAAQICPRRLIAALAGKGIAFKTARSVLERLLDAETEAAMIRAALDRAFPDAAPGKDEARVFLRAEGFSHAAIRAWIENV